MTESEDSLNPAELSFLDDRPSCFGRLRSLWLFLKKKILECNVFESEATWHDERRLRTQIISTRIYILLLSVSIVILIIYTWSTSETQTFIVSKPSQTVFERLQANPKYSSTLNCPCQSISIPYGSFISISYYLHQFCASDFIRKSPEWLNLLFYRNATLEYSYLDYRLFAVPQFQWLFSLCDLANVTLINALTLFNSSVLVTGYPYSRENIKAQGNSAIAQFRQSTPRGFVRSLNFIQSMTHGNGIVSATSSNWHFFAFNRNQESDSLWTEPRSYGNDGNCSCGRNATCTSPATIGGWQLAGFLVGCYPLESLLKSTLACLYNVTCINQLKSMYHPSNLSFSSLDSALSSPDVSVQTLVNELMVDRWESNISYDQYYASCAPLECTYTLNQRTAIIYIVTSSFGLFGGLSATFKLFVPIFVKIAQYLLMRCRRQQTTIVPIAAE